MPHTREDVVRILRAHFGQEATSKSSESRFKLNGVAMVDLFVTKTGVRVEVQPILGAIGRRTQYEGVAFDALMAKVIKRIEVLKESRKELNAARDAVRAEEKVKNERLIALAKLAKPESDKVFVWTDDLGPYSSPELLVKSQVDVRAKIDLDCNQLVASLDIRADGLTDAQFAEKVKRVLAVLAE